MRHHPSRLCVLALASALTTGCDLLNRDSDSTPTTPTPTPAPVSLDVFAGTWASVTPSTPPTGCGSVKYIVTPLNATNANVTFSATCAGNIQVSGTGAGKVVGSSLEWSAQGLVSQGGVNCPFTFPNGKAVEDAAGVKVTYSGTVCGIPVSGSETVKKA